MHLELRHLRLVVAIAETGGVTRAARRLGLTQPALSHQLRDIEAKLRAPLFLRQARRMVATPAGERLVASARRVLHEVETAEAEILAGPDAVGAGLLRVCTECYTGYHWLPAVLTRFREGWPRVEVRIVADATPRPLPALLDGALDVAIVHRRAESRRLVYAPLFEDELVAVMHPGHALARRPFLIARDFADQHLFQFGPSYGEPTIVRKLLRPAGVEPRQISRLQLTEAIIEMVKAGFGIGTLARWAVEPHVRAGTLVAVPITRQGLRRQWHAATRAGGAVPPFLADFVTALARHMRRGVTLPRSA
ncbi:MAG TPA: LysR family transcriptional regulator [Gemmatimonadaceae bacterium]|nr:LysR family transcriptional regulator [Gemmatimonadaceae bacterium]